MALWPAAFPQTPERTGYSDDEADNVIRSQMGYGPAKLRVRTTAILDNIVAVFTIDATQKAIYQTFYTTNKSIQFDWDDLLGDGLQAYRFLSPPVYREFTCDVWRMQVQLERMP